MLAVEHARRAMTHAAISVNVHRIEDAPA